MWLSKEILSNTKEKKDTIIGEVTSIDGSKVYVQADQEYRSIPMLVPFGIAYNPPAGEKAAVISAGDSFACLGTISHDKNLNPGEIMLYSSGGASIVLKNDGRVLINGTAIE